MDDLKIVAIQDELAWEDAPRNRERFRDIIESLSSPPDLVLLPEMFTTGFTTKPRDVAEGMDGETARWMLSLASDTSAALAGSAIIAEGGRYYNRMLIAKPTGEMLAYDKRHLFPIADEDKEFTRGKDPLIFEWQGWRIRPLICYDLRFPVWARNHYAGGEYSYDLIVCVANWPTKRSETWKTLLRARAIENLAYIVGVNRIGVDGNGVRYSGDTMLIGPAGEQLSQTSPDVPTLLSATLSKSSLLQSRSDFPFGPDADEFSLSLESECPEHVQNIAAPVPRKK